MRGLNDVIECVINVSEGRDAGVLAALASACGGALLDVHTDADHHRSVFTLGGSAGEVEAAAWALTREALARLDLGMHDGVHPRLGVVDVVPFVALGPETEDVAVEAARRFGTRLADELGVPVFFYDRADPAGHSLPETRREAFVTRPPDLGPARPHPTAGATAVGARAVLVAVNCELDTADVALASDIARAVRERDGGLPGVRALGLFLASKGCAQVSMNLVALEHTGVEAACNAVEAEARARGAAVARLEVVGLVPQAEWDRWSAEFRSWAELGADHTIESRLARR